MIQELIDTLNTLLKKSSLILHIESVNTAITSVEIVTYTLYVKKDKDKPKIIYSVSKTRTKGSEKSVIEKEIYKQLLLFIKSGGIKEYE